jgi:hypothetical protein
MKTQTRFIDPETGKYYHTIYFEIVSREGISIEDYKRIEGIIEDEIYKIMNR